MQRSLVTAAIIATLVFAATANAADLPTKAPVYKAPPPLVSYNWTGLYLGINGGGAWGREDWLDNVGAGGGVPENFRPNGGVFGGQLGFRWQWNQLVLGIEGTWDWAGLRDTLAPGGGTEEFKITSLYTATGQIGWAAWDHSLVYVKGGWAGAATKADVNLNGDIASNSANRQWLDGRRRRRLCDLAECRLSASNTITSISAMTRSRLRAVVVAHLGLLPTPAA